MPLCCLEKQINENIRVFVKKLDNARNILLDLAKEYQFSNDDF